jgi:hypothetical protein
VPGVVREESAQPDDAEDRQRLHDEEDRDQKGDRARDGRRAAQDPDKGGVTA